jgi:molybdopterin/thiamine biosynthesis adenylyltransferase/rhodanese-related sulfurtransferase
MDDRLLSRDRRENRTLSDARVLVVGVGGLGSPAALQLAAAGLGTLVLVDFDRVEESNLQRQVIFDTNDVGRPKVEAARDRLRLLAPGVRIETIDEPFSERNAAALVDSVDVVLDGADNFPARYLVNDACVLRGRPNVFGSVSRFEGQVAIFAAPGGPCYRCLHPEPPPEGLIQNCSDGGILGVLPGVVGALQALEAVKLLTGAGEPLVGRLLIYDALRMRIRDITLPRDPDCPVCGDVPRIGEIRSVGAVCGMALPLTIGTEEFRQWRRDGRPHLLLDVREPDEHAAGRIEGARLLPIARLAAEVASLSTEHPVVVYCRSGMRSGRAARLLRDRGIDARSLSGGFDAWRVSGE